MTVAAGIERFAFMAAIEHPARAFMHRPAVTQIDKQRHPRSNLLVRQLIEMWSEVEEHNRYKLLSAESPVRPLGYHHVAIYRRRIATDLVRERWSA